MYARRFHRRDDLDNPEWLQSSAKTELVAGKYYLVKIGRVFGTELQVWGYSMVAEIPALFDVIGNGEEVM